MKKERLFSMAVFMIVTAALVALCNMTYANRQRMATLTGVRGEVMVKPAGAAEATQAVNKMVVNEGDLLKTSGGSSAIIRFDDGSMVKLGPLAVMSIGKMSDAGGKSATQLDVGVGKTWARVKKLDRAATFVTKTPTAVAGVRGTYYSSEVDRDTTSTFDVFEGSVAVSPAGNPKGAMMVGANQTTTVAKDKPPTKPAAIPKERLEKDASGFTASEYTASSFDVQVSVNPPSITAGGKAVITVKAVQGGAPYKNAASLHLKLSGTAVFVSNGANEIDITTGDDGTATLEVTGSAAENVVVDVTMRLRVKKNK